MLIQYFKKRNAHTIFIVFFKFIFDKCGMDVIDIFNNRQINTTALYIINYNIYINIIVF